MCMYMIVDMTLVVIKLAWMVLRYAHIGDIWRSDQLAKADIAPIWVLKSQHGGGSDIEACV